MENMLKTILLLGLLSVLLISLGGLFGGQQGILIAFVIALALNGASYFYSDKLALSMSGAQPISKEKAPELYAMVADLAKKMQMPMPKLYMVPAAQANAFATGRDPNHASVAVTQGLLDTLSPQEVKAVLAHELGHVQNRDILIATIAAVLASTISFVANMSLWSGMSSDEDNQGNGILALVAALTVPIAASLIQLAVSRQREFGADATGARVMGSGDHLAKALIKIHDTTRHAPMQTSPALASLYIENPFGGLGGSLMNMFSTHPPVAERVKRLQQIK